MHLRSLKIFCDVVRLGSFSKAAELNCVSQPNASQVVHQLEERLGVPLIDRSKRPFVITPEGQHYFEGCRDVVQRYEDLEQEVRALHNACYSPLRVAAIYSVGLKLMHQVVGEFRTDAPEVDLRVEYMHPEKVQQAVLTGEAHLGVVSYPESTKKITAQLWREERFALAVAPNHSFARKASVTLQELRGQVMVMPQSGLRVRDEVDRCLASHRVPVQVALEFDNLESVKRAIEVEEGAGLLPVDTFASETAAGSLVRVDLVTADGQPEPFTRPLGVIRRRDDDLSPAASLFLELLQQHADVPPDSVQEAAPLRRVGSDRAPAARG